MGKQDNPSSGKRILVKKKMYNHRSFRSVSFEMRFKDRDVQSI